MNYGGDHPANYRKCLVYKKLQQKLHTALRKKRSMHSLAQPGMTNAQTALNYQIQNYQLILGINQCVNNKAKVDKMFGKLMVKMGTNLNIFTVLVSSK